MTKFKQILTFRRVYADYTTCGFEAFKDLEFYLYSRTRICVRIRESLSPELWAVSGGEILTKLGLCTVQELAAWILKQGAVQIRKPKPVRYTPPLYD